MSVHHFDELSIVMKEINRVLRPGGYLYIREHDVDNEHTRKFVVDLHNKYEDGCENIYCTSKEKLKGIITSHGFSHLKDDFYSKKFNNKQRIYHSLFKKN